MSRNLSYVFGRNAFSLRCIRCLIMVWQSQQVRLSGRSRRRNKLKHGLKIKHEVVWKFGLKLKGAQQSCTWAAIPRQYSLFPSKITWSLSPSALSGEKLVLQGLTQREGALSFWSLPWVRAATQVPLTSRERVTKTSRSNSYSLNP